MEPDFAELQEPEYFRVRVVLHVGGGLLSECWWLNAVLQLSCGTKPPVLVELGT